MARLTAEVVFAPEDGSLIEDDLFSGGLLHWRLDSQGRFVNMLVERRLRDKDLPGGRALLETVMASNEEKKAVRMIRLAIAPDIVHTSASEHPKFDPDDWLLMGEDVDLVRSVMVYYLPEEKIFWIELGWSEVPKEGFSAQSEALICFGSPDADMGVTRVAGSMDISGPRIDFDSLRLRQLDNQFLNGVFLREAARLLGRLALPLGVDLPVGVLNGGCDEAGGVFRVTDSQKFGVQEIRNQLVVLGLVLGLVGEEYCRQSARIIG